MDVIKTTSESQPGQAPADPADNFEVVVEQPRSELLPAEPATPAEPVEPASAVAAAPSEPPQPPPDSPRFNQIYGKMKGEARRADAAEAQSSKLEQQVAELSNQLKAITTNQAQYNNQSQAINLAQQIATAKENGDVANEVLLTQQLNQLYQPAVQQQPQIQAPQVAPAPPAQSDVSLADQAAIAVFQSQNSWFNTDQALTGAMMGVLNSVMSEPQFSSLPLTTQLTESLSRVRKSFPDKFQSVLPQSGMGSVGNGAPPKASAPVTRKITPDESNMAVQLFSGLGMSRTQANKEFAKAVGGK